MLVSLIQLINLPPSQVSGFIHSSLSSDWHYNNQLDGQVTDLVHLAPNLLNLIIETMELFTNAFIFLVKVHGQMMVLLSTKERVHLPPLLIATLFVNLN